MVKVLWFCTECRLFYFAFEYNLDYVHAHFYLFTHILFIETSSNPWISCFLGILILCVVVMNASGVVVTGQAWLVLAASWSVCGLGQRALSSSSTVSPCVLTPGQFLWHTQCWCIVLCVINVVILSTNMRRLWPLRILEPAVYRLADIFALEYVLYMHIFSTILHPTEHKPVSIMMSNGNRNE